MRLGGESDPRNKALMKMFNLINIGERAGSGVPNIFNVWADEGWEEPVIEERFDPDRTVLSLSFKKKQAIKTSDKKQAIKTSDKKQSIKTSAHKEAIVVYLTNNASAKCAEISALIGVSIPRTRAILSEMVEDDIIKAEGENKNRIYKLKAQKRK
jgi:predicted HTH transcriptional regulator